MRNEEFDVARDLIAGRGPELREPIYQSHALTPASFREIDGEVLARQYVAHRKLLESEAKSREFGSTEALPSHVRLTRLQGERREIPDQPARAGWLSAMARVFFGS